ncbi:LacI family DNA-binding transcriptional regulator [Rhizobium sp. RU36D]|uniref:LacI family DNA-binding transcriptional regulator n=1 Tax=Rhizobium sp. RU36D TaxID=1907415 RepID=UPI0009D7F5D8|nr:LacI family DNA-binding transcriptional regulator [Rhizobium sp. RU36D]SMC82895.1 transcriptional regulator, LacI family [Rhizobium sp. RU36D]
MALVRPGSNLGDIASALGVSVATVSNALSGKGRVSAELVERVRAKAAELGYVPSQAGRALRTGRTRVLGLVLPDISHPLFPQIAQAIEYAASQAGYGLLIADSRDDVATQTAAIARLIERDVDGILIIPRRGTRIADIGCPVAVIDSLSTPGNTVSADHWQGGELVIDHLITLGHQNLLLIGNNPSSNVQTDRIGGMKSRMPAGAQAEIFWIETHDKRHGHGSPLGLADKVAAGVTAIAAVSDLHALRALTELNRAGIRVPEDVSVTGFDDLIWSSVVTPSLTTVKMDMASIAALAIEALVRVIADTKRTHNVAAATPAKVPMALLIRQTSAAARPSIGTGSATEAVGP